MLEDYSRNSVSPPYCTWIVTDDLARKAKVLGSNADAATRFGTGIDAISADLRKGLKQLHHVQHDFGKTLKADLGSLTVQCQQVSTVETFWA
jgi:hypothetical protein